MQILRRLPFFDVETTAAVNGGTAIVRPYQIIVWVSLSLKRSDTLSPETPRFPAILDTANNHNFSIQEDHFVQWSGLEFASFPRLGQIRIGLQTLPLLAASVWLYRNKPGARDAFARGVPFRLDLPEGIAVYPHGQPTVARLPTLGLRAVVSNRLRLAVDGAGMSVSLRT